MSFRSIIYLVAGLFCAGRVVASPDPPLDPGEQLKYSVSWAIVPGAGEITVSAEPAATAGQLKITSETSTRGLARFLLPFDAAADSLYDVKSGRLLSLHERSQTRGKHAEHMVTFDYVDRQAIYAEMGATIPRYLSMPTAGGPSDLITALLETRNWNLKPGESRDALVLFNDDFYQLTIHAVRYEDVSTDLGDFHTLVLEPRMDKTAPKGMFRKGSTVRVWISQDQRRLPVKFEVEFNIGTGTATLESYVPPTAMTAPPATPASPTTAPATDAKDSRP